MPLLQCVAQGAAPLGLPANNVNPLLRHSIFLVPQPPAQAAADPTPACSITPCHTTGLHPPRQALDHLEYPKRLRKLLLTPEREVAVELALLRDNGEVATFNAYRVQVRPQLLGCCCCVYVAWCMTTGRWPPSTQPCAAARCAWGLFPVLCCAVLRAGRWCSCHGASRGRAGSACAGAGSLPTRPPAAAPPCATTTPCSARLDCAQHDNSRGPYKGGLRFHPQVDIDDVRR